MQTQEVVIKPILKVLLKSDSQNLEEVVVTAMGIKRSEKSLGYAVSSVKGDEITKARESNVLNSLSGKIAGLQIAQSSGTVCFHWCRISEEHSCRSSVCKTLYGCISENR